MPIIGGGIIERPFFPPRLAYDTDSRLEYLGKGAPGSATSASVFMIVNFSYDSDSNIVSILPADGNYNFDNVWDDRATLSYS